MNKSVETIHITDPCISGISPKYYAININSYEDESDTIFWDYGYTRFNDQNWIITDWEFRSTTLAFPKKLATLMQSANRIVYFLPNEEMWILFNAQNKNNYLELLLKL